MKKKVAVLGFLILALMFGAIACGGNTKKDFTWTGLEDLTVIKGDVVDPAQGVTVKNGNTDITGDIVILNSEEHEAELTALGVWDDFEDFNYNIINVYTVYYQVTSGNKTETKTKEISVVQGHNVGNGDFSVSNASGFYDWMLDTPGGTANVEKVTENSKLKPKFNITSSGNAWWALQYINKVNLKSGESYRITVRAKSATGKSIAFGFEDPSNNYAMLRNLTVHKLTAEYQTYDSYFTAGSNYTNAKAVLYLGKMLPSDTGAHSFVIDRINIEKIDKCTEVVFSGLSDLTFNSSQVGDLDLTDGVSAVKGSENLTDRIRIVGEVAETVTDNTTFDIAYVIDNENGPIAFANRKVRVNVFKVNQHDIANGDFSGGLDYWTQDIFASGAGDATYEVVDGAAKITIANPSSANWHIQLHQNITMAKDANYLLKARAKASIARDINYEVRGGAEGSAGFTMQLTTDWKDFEFAYNSKIAGGAKISFLLGGGGSGNNNSIIYLDNIEVVLDPDQTQYEAWQLINPEFNSGMKSWGYEGAVNYTTGGDEDKYIVANITDNTGAAWEIQLRQDGLALESGVTYKVTVVAKASVARNITLEALYLGGKDKLNQSTSLALTTDIKTFTFEFTPTGDRGDARVGLLLGGSGVKDTTITFYKINIEKVTSA